MKSLQEQQNQQGMTLIEVIVYFTLFILITFSVVLIMVNFSQSYSSIKGTQRLHSSSVNTLNRIVFEVRNASDINSASGSNLSLEGISGNPIVFSLQSGQLVVDEDGAGPNSPIALTDSKVIVTGVTFSQIGSSGTDNQAVHVELTLETSCGNIMKQATFQTTTSLRGAY